MQHIPDNEFDRLFKDRLMDAEVQPSGDLWERIAPEIAIKKKKRNVYIYWSAAATVLVALSAGLLFKPPEKIALHAPVAVTEQKVSKEDINGLNTKGSNDERNETLANVAVKHPNTRNLNKIPTTRENNDVASSPVAEKSLVAVQPVDADNHLISTRVEEPQAVINTEVETAIAESALANNTKPVTEAPDMPVALNESTVVEQLSRPRIRNAGDLVNFVVDKLDKREQKFVEFKTDEDEGTALVAINIGPLKINQRRTR